MKISLKKLKSNYEWHDWFAWRPVIIDNGLTLVWLETIERKKEKHCMVDDVYTPAYTYRAKQRDHI